MLRDLSMNICQIHKYYWHRDGASNYALYLSRLLEERGNKVIPFAMQSKHNLDTEYKDFFVSEMNLDDPKTVSFFNKFKYAGRMLYSCEAKNKINKLLKKEKIEIAHLHNIYHHISPSILPVLKKSGVKIVMTLHDYKLICPNYTIFHHGKVHEEDCKGLYLSCIKNKCHKNSRVQSMAVTAEMIFHHKIMKYYEHYVDKFIAPSEFIMNKCIEYGWPKEKFVHITHPVDLNTFGVQELSESYVAYVGRLSDEKGIGVLLSAAAKTPDIRYKIVGQGPLEKSLHKKVEEDRLDNVSFEGFKNGGDLEDLIGKARLIVVPSMWYENYPLSILEAKAMSKLVVASDIGGIREMLPKEFLVKPGDAHDLAQKIKKWYHTPPSRRSEWGHNFRKEVERDNNPGTHIKNIISLYESL